MTTQELEKQKEKKGLNNYIEMLEFRIRNLTVLREAFLEENSFYS
jgi:hypothetical protein